MKTKITTLAISLALPFCILAGPKEEVALAINKLEKQSYTWKVEEKDAQSQPTRAAVRLVGGKTDGNTTIYQFKRGEEEIELLQTKNQAVFKTDGAWKTL